MLPIGKRPAKELMPKRSIRIAGRKTSMCLEDAFWVALKEIAAAEGVTVHELPERVKSRRTDNLSSALRLYVLAHYRGANDGGSGPGLKVRRRATRR